MVNTMAPRVADRAAAPKQTSAPSSRSGMESLGGRFHPRSIRSWSRSEKSRMPATDAKES